MVLIGVETPELDRLLPASSTLNTPLVNIDTLLLGLLALLIGDALGELEQ